MAQSISKSFNLAQRILAVKQTVSEAAADREFLNHPDWEVRYGDRGRELCTRDACFHLEFLAGAVRANCPEAFADYARWTVRMLSSRGIDSDTVQGNFAQLESQLVPVLSPADLSAISIFLESGRRACVVPQVPSETQELESPLRLTARAFLASILSGQRQAALSIVEEALRNGASHVDIYVDVITESLRGIGSFWESSKISVAQEHMASAIAQYVIAMIYPRLISTSPNRGRMVVTGVCGEQHQIGANLVADALEANGWMVRFLGTNLPHSTILSTIEEMSADVLCISTTLVSNLSSAADLITVVRNKLRHRAPRIVMGGAAYRVAPRFVDEIGSAEAIPDLRQALVTLCP